MTKKDWQIALVNLAATILGGYIVVMLTLPAQAPEPQPQIHPKLIYVQHQEPAKAGKQVFLVAKR